MTNTLYTNDNLFILHGLNSKSVDLIYLDPPFNSKRTYSAPIGSKAAKVSFKDMWTWTDVNEAYLDTMATKYPIIIKLINTSGVLHSKAMAAYLTYMVQRFIQMHRVLKDTGNLYLHCDPTASHYLKLLLDMVFGKNNFRNEIVWCYRQGGRSHNNYAPKHDIILWYTKSKEKWKFNSNPVRVPYQGTGGYVSTGRNIVQGIEYKVHPLGKIPEDWWDIPALNPMSKERTGYPTQKPLALLHRIIEGATDIGDIVMDPFCGCATTCVAAQQLGRKWIGIDIEKNAVGLLVDRLSDDAGMFKDFIATDKIPVRTDVDYVPPNKQSIKEQLYKEQAGKCNGCGVAFEIRNLAVDHIIPVHHGGGSYYENYQLLCGHCNSTKGARPLEYLRIKVEARTAEIEKEVFFSEKVWEKEKKNVEEAKHNN